LNATYEKDVLPFIMQQINHTAATFFYDLERFNKELNERGLPAITDPVGNYIIGRNEIGGVCEDYASHFIDNYKGLGEIYFVGVNYDGEASLFRRVKLFEKTDIIINDIKTVDDFIEEIYQWVISNAKADESKYIWKNAQWKTFYTRTRNGTIYWTENESERNPSIPFKKEHIKINLKNYQAERDRQREKYINEFYNYCIKHGKEIKGIWSFNYDLLDFKLAGWNVDTLKFHVNKNGKLFLVEETSIPTPKFHAGETDIKKYSMHAWVRIVWRDMTIDIDPTWYDGGQPLEFGALEEIIPNRVNSFPVAYSSYKQSSNTKLISPLTGTLKSRNRYTFILSSTDYSAFAIVINDKWHYFTKNDKTGNYELNLLIPNDVDSIVISRVMASGNRLSGNGLIEYKVKK